VATARYWSTLTETIGGDCGDMVLAKYVVLSGLGIRATHLRIAYARTADSKGHMVLEYAIAKGRQAIILDNVTNRIAPRSKRQDLTLVYAFNEKWLWQLDNSGRTLRRLPARTLKKWVAWRNQHLAMLSRSRELNSGRPRLPNLG
jgi:hypothetical protein